MARELAPFNIRILTVQLGAFDTSFVNDLAVTKTPYPDDYKGSVTQKVIDSLNDFHPDGDHKKAIQVIYDFAVGEGVGKGREQERVLVLGRDMWTSWEDATKQMLHASEISKEVCNNVYIEK
jgi:NAD(P)-dependent dehydrogenase (short-subunit alcohol dehydrogenase family)